MTTGLLEIFVSNLNDGQQYWWVITDSRGNIYSDTFTYSAGQPIQINTATQLPPGLLNEHSGNFKFYIQTNSKLGSVPFDFKRSVDCVEFEIKCSDFFEKEQIGLS